MHARCLSMPEALPAGWPGRGLHEAFFAALTGSATSPCAGLVFWQVSDSVEQGVRARQALLYFSSLFGAYYGE